MSDQTFNMSLLDEATKRKKLKASDVRSLKKGAEKFGGDMAKSLISSGKASEEEVAEMKAGLFGLPYVNLTTTDVPQEVLNIIPSRIARTYRFVSFESDGNSIKLGIMEPIDLKAEEALQLIANRNGLEFVFYVISNASFDHVFGEYSDMESEVKEAILQSQTESNVESEESSRLREDESIEIQVRNAPITKVVASILKNAIQKNASDIHIEPLGKEVRVRYRVDGVLNEVVKLPIKLLSPVTSRIKVLSNLKLDESRLPQDGRFSGIFANKQIDFRVSIMPVTSGEVMSAEKVVMRVLDKSKGMLNFEALGLWGKRRRDVEDALKQPYGMFLMTGPTGSGKTTTLYAALSILNIEGSNVVTLEDPVEYFMSGVNQSQINPDIGFTFAKGLRSILRQDPNSIMVGEIRDQETAEMAIHSSLTGHIVLSTLHTNTAGGAIPRLVDMGIEPFLIASATNTVAAQRLVRTLCEDSKEKITLPPEMQANVEKEVAKIPPEELKELGIKNLDFYEAKPCSKCVAGYRGRLATYEVITLTPELRGIIPKKPSQEDIEKIAREQKCISLFQDGLLKALAGKTSLEEVLRITKENNSFIINSV
jgi:type IV pilus assembly protein PilB